jgi:DNA-binding XRE family transcriptional regulator
MLSSAELKKKMLAVGKPRAAYAALKEDMRAADALLEARLKSGLTQAQVAQRMGTTVAGVAKLEASLLTKPSPTIATLRRYAAAIGKKLEIRLV